MTIVVVATPKGGAGKSTLTTQIAGYYASLGHAVALSDLDKQGSADLWRQLRPSAANPVHAWPSEQDKLPKLPKGISHGVIDTPAGLHGWRLREILEKADKIVIPLQPSIFDMHVTREFFDLLVSKSKGMQARARWVGMRVDARTLAAGQLHDFVQSLPIERVTNLRSTQYYLHMAAHGLSLFDLQPHRVEKDLEQWQPLCRWLNA
jgi:chromosome partitioning protein